MNRKNRQRSSGERRVFVSAALLGALCAMAASAPLPAAAQNASGNAVYHGPYPEPPVYPYDTSPVPLTKRQAELAKRPLPAALQPVPHITCPLYVMEFHIWWRSPYGTEGRPGYGSWDTNDDIDTASRTGGPAWMRSSRHVGYSVAGIYNSEDEGILRWQLRCLHNTGVDGVFIQMYPEWNQGDTFVGAEIFARILKIAGEEGVKIGIHDEIAFRPGRPAQNPAVMAKRTSDFLKRFGDNPAMLRIDGKPVYAFQYWSRWDNRITDDQLVGMMKEIEASYGKPVYWMPFHAPSDSLFRQPEIPSFVANGDSNMIARNVRTFYPTDLSFDPGKMKERLDGLSVALKTYPDKNLGMWVYPGFNDSDRRKEGFNWVPRQGGLTLVERLRQYVERKPNFIMLSSWNDWEENTAIEPGLSYDGFDGDPYLYCRILAAAKGKTFTPPPLPPKSSVDPWLWHKLYGIDGLPPEVAFSPASGDASKVQVKVTDDDGKVVSTSVLWAGDASARFTDTPNYKGVSLPPGTVVSPAGLVLEPSKTLTLPLTPEAAAAGTAEDPAYIGLEFADSAAGWIEVRFPSLHPIVQYKGNGYDEPKYPVHASFDVMNNGGKSRVAIRKMLEWKRGVPAPFISLTWHPEKGANTAVTVQRLDIFTGTPGKAGEKTGKATKAVSLTVTPPNPAEKVVYASATDDSGNTSPPDPYLFP